jgi:FkbH-like protein
MVIDDNPAERDMIRAQLPSVEILELPNDPVYYAETLRGCTRWYPFQLTQNDREKGVFFIQENKRKQSLLDSKTLEEHLMQSGLVATIGLSDKFTMPRIVQLFNKTNQFNLTTKRYSQSQLEKITLQEGNSLWYCELSDKFGDYGIIGASLLCSNTIDSFLLSCRAFGRKIEYGFLWWILNLCKSQGHQFVYGLSIPTQKNSMTVSFYKDAGFIKDEEDTAINRWKINVTMPLASPPAWIILKEKNK